LPKVGAVAWVTAKEAVLQPLFVILTLIGIFALFIFLLIPYNTLGEDIKLVITQGLTVVKLFCAFLAVWTASSTIADELDGKTALVTLAKPISRTKFIIGKYTGVMIAVTLLFLILGTFFLNTVSYKVVYDAREASREVPTAIECAEAVIQILPGLALAYLETVILAAIAIAISTRLPLLPNLTLVLIIYLLGNIAPVIVQASADQNPIVVFVANIVSVILPCRNSRRDGEGGLLGICRAGVCVRAALLWGNAHCLVALIRGAGFGIERWGVVVLVEARESLLGQGVPMSNSQTILYTKRGLPV
jgi:ABC-type transport system involved in multi-copper enzyme maturation permease subunit